MLTRRQEAVYLMQVVRLRKLMVLKDNPAFTYQHTNRRKAITNIHSLQDKIVEATVTNQVYGNADSVDHQKTVEQTIHTTLENDRKRVYKVDDNRYINTAIKLNTQRYSEILNNRLNIESIKLETKIEDEIRKSKYHGLSESEIRTKLIGEFKDTAKLRTANIIRDALHTNEANIGWIHALENGFQYKVWNNGRGKGKVRAWHRARFISSVPIDEPFDIFGSYHAELMYPGDLNGGAENVANCKCWLRYTNSKPSNLRRKASGSGSYSKSTQSNKIDNSNKNRFKNTQIKRDLSKSVTVDGKTAFGIGECSKDKIAFKNKYGIKYDELTSDEIKFIKLYSREGFSIINSCLREIVKTRNPYKRWKIKKKYSKEWDEMYDSDKYYLSLNKMIKVSKSLFKKGKVLENDLVVVRKQWKPLTEYADGDEYNNAGYLSTSISKNVKNYGDYIHYIRIPAGEKIIYIEGVSVVSDEFEIIIPPKKKIKFVKQVSTKLQEWTL